MKTPKKDTDAANALFLIFVSLALFVVSLIPVLWLKFFGKKQTAKVPPGPEQKPLPQPQERKERLSGWQNSLETLWKGRIRMEFEYVDSKGENSFREIILEEIGKSPEGEIYLRGFCKLRMERRNFRASRIQGDIINRYTGEVLGAEKFLRGLMGTVAPGACLR